MTLDTLEPQHSEETNVKRRTTYFGDWDSVLADVDVLHTAGYQRVGNLSLGQICNHLAIVLEGAVDGFPMQLPWLVQRILRIVFLPSMLKHKPTNFRAPAPAFAAQKEPVDDSVGVERLRTAIEHFCARAGDYHTHPAFGNLTREQWSHQQLWHCEHHLSFLIPNTTS